MSQPPVPFGLGMPPAIPGRVIRRVQRYIMPDGQAREKRWISSTVQAADGSIHTVEHTEVVPPLACACVPGDMTDVSQCCHCHAIVCRTRHTFTCDACGQNCCTKCRVRTEIQGREVQLCPPCAQESLTPKVIRIIRKLIWGK